MNRTSFAWALLWLGLLPGIAAAAPSAAITALAGPTSANAGESYGAISYTVTNQGDAATPNTPLHFFLSTSLSPSVDSLKTAYANSSNPQPGADTYFLVSRLLSPIEAGQWSSGSLTVSWIPNWLSGTYYLTAMTDFWFLAQELTNVATMAAPVAVAGPFVADLLVTSLSAPTTMNAGQQYLISGATANDSVATGTARNYDVGLYLSTDDLLSPDDSYLEVLAPGPLAPGQSVTSSNLVTIPNSMAGGTYRLIAKADRLGSVYESNEQNNIYVMPESVAINGPYIPDLAITALSGPTTASAGDPYVLSFTVANLSSLAPANNVHIGIYLSTDATLSTDDLRLTDAGIGNLGPGGVYTWNNLQSVLPTSMSGTYWLIAMVDPGSNLLGSITEANETNNVLVMADPVIVDGPHLPDLQVTAVSGPTSASVGQPYTIQWSVTNSGEWPLSGTFFINFYLTQNTATLVSQSPVAFASGSQLAAGATRTGTTAVAQVPALLNGTYQLVAKVRCATGITESDTNNNTLVGNSVLVGVDALPPVVTIESPADGLLTNATSVDLVVLATDDTAVQTVTANGAPLTLSSDGLWRATVALSEGDNTFDVVATDTGGYQTHQSVTVRRDSIPPALVVSAPVDGLGTTAASVSVVGQVTDASPLALTVGGTLVSLASDGSFSSSAALLAGDNAIDILAVDAAGNRAAQTLHVRRLTGTLNLLVTAPRQGFSVASPLVLVRGSVSGGAPPITVTVNGRSASLESDGSFSEMADAPTGTVTLVVVARDSTQATAQQVITGQQNAGAIAGGTTTSGNTTPGTVFTYDGAGNLTGIIITTSDVNNCGGPGNVCRGTAHGTAACQNGQCAVMSGGQIINVTSDPANCGDVGNVCPTIANGSPTCTSGTCGITCTVGYTPAVGSCVDLTSDPSNCGWAGHVCQGTGGNAPFCLSGRCGTVGIPTAYSLNGVAAPGELFKAPMWSGITITGSNMANVTYVELEDWGRDTVDADLYDVESIPVFSGNVMSHFPFQATSTSITIPPTVFQSIWQFSWREWYKIRLHYLDNGIDNYLLVDVAISLDDQAPSSLPPPEITGISAVRVFPVIWQATAWWQDDNGNWDDDGGYDPATGFIRTRVENMESSQNPGIDLTELTPAPIAIAGTDFFQTEYPIYKITNQGVYIQAGLNPQHVVDDATEFVYASFVFPYNGETDGLYLGHDYRTAESFPSNYAPGIILRGTNLVNDGVLHFSNPVGTSLPGDLSSSIYLNERIVVRPAVNPGNGSTYIELDSPRGMAATPWLIKWIDNPIIDSIGTLPYMVYDQVITITGQWFTGVRSVTFSGNGKVEPLDPAASSPPGPEQYYVVDDKHIEVLLSTTGGPVPRQATPECFAGAPTWGVRRFAISTPGGAAVGSLEAVDPSTVTPPVPNIHCAPPSGGIDGGGSSGSSGDPNEPEELPNGPTGGGSQPRTGGCASGDATNTVCPP